MLRPAGAQESEFAPFSPLFYVEKGRGFERALPYYKQTLLPRIEERTIGWIINTSRRMRKRPYTRFLLTPRIFMA